MERRRGLVLTYLGVAVVFLGLAAGTSRRATMLPLGVVFLVLALVQWRQRPRPGRRS